MIAFDRQNLPAMALRRGLEDHLVREITARYQHINRAVRDPRADRLIICNNQQIHRG